MCIYAHGSNLTTLCFNHHTVKEDRDDTRHTSLAERIQNKPKNIKDNILGIGIL